MTPDLSARPRAGGQYVLVQGTGVSECVSVHCPLPCLIAMIAAVAHAEAQLSRFLLSGLAFLTS